MSDAPQGPGWWQASDGNWYPPQEPPTEPTPTTQPVPPVPPPPGPPGPPAPPGPPTATFGPTPPGPPPPGAGGPNRTPLFIGIAVLVVALGVIGFLLLGGDDDDETSDDSDRTEQTEESDDTDQTEESDDTDQTEESDDTDQTDTDQSDESDRTDIDDLDSLLLTPADIGSEFNEIEMPPERDGTLCGTPSFRDTSDPEDQSGIAVQSISGSVGGIEELFLYASESEASDAYDTAVEAAGCDEGTLADGTTVSIDGFDATDTVDADEAYGFNLSATDVEVDVMVARVGRILIILQGNEDSTASGSLVNFEDIATLAVDKVKAG